MHLNEKMNLSVLLYLTIALAVVNCRVAPQTKAAENKDNKDKRGALSGSYGAPSSSLSYSSVGSPSSYESSSSYTAAPSSVYAAPLESGSSYSDSSYSSAGYGNSDYSSSNSGFKPIPSSSIEHPTSSVSYGSPSLTASAYHPQTFTGILPSAGLDYSSMPYGSFGLSSLSSYGGFGGAYPYGAFGGFSQGLGALQHYPRVMTAIPISGISTPYAGIPVHGDYSALTAAPIAHPVSLPLYPAASLYSSPISPNYHSLSSSAYSPSQYSSPSYSSNSYSSPSYSSNTYSSPAYSSNSYGSPSLSSYSSKPYASTYSSSSDYSSSNKYASSGSSSYPSSGYSSSSYSSPYSGSSSYTVPPYSRYPTASRDSYSSGSSSYSSSPYKSSHSKEYNF